MTYRWASLRGVDFSAWSELVRAIADADATDEYYSPEDLAEELDEDGVDLDRDTFGVYRDDELVGYGEMRVRAAAVDGAARAILMGGVHPAHRGQGIGRELLQRLEDAGTSRAADIHPDLGVLFSSEAGSEAATHRALLEHRDYQPTRWFYSMSRAVQRADADAELDPRVRPFRAEDDPAVRHIHADAFSTHWSFAAPDDQEWRTWFAGSRAFRPQHSVVIGDHGRLDGIVLAYEYQPHELWIGQVGVVPAARRQGMARAGLQAVFASAARSGQYSVIGLGVDSESADGAGELYEKVGFDVARTSIVYLRPA